MDKRRLWLSPRALRLHAVILIVVPAFLALCVWQITRALGGNSLSWAYVFEWPIFAGYAVYMWWRFLHEPADDTSAGASTDAEATTEATTSTPAPGADDAGNDHETETSRAQGQAPAQGEDREDAELAAYNEYLAQLAERDRATGC
jgi:hypothetical protein